MVSQVMIEVTGLRNQFGQNVVHDGLDLQVRRGEILSVVGGSGSGKSVLLRSIIGLHRPTVGTVVINGIDMLKADDTTRQKIEQNIGVLFQKGALYSSLNVIENVMLPLREYTALDDTTIRELAMSKLALVGLNRGVALNTVQSLSGGMIKRVALARALILEPQILFLDEPTAGLDPIGANAFDELLLTIQQALSLTVFLVTHDLDSLYKVSDRIAVLAQKKVLVVDTPERVANYDEPWIAEYFQGPRGRAAQHISGELVSGAHAQHAQEETDGN